MRVLDALAEQRICDAQARGEFLDLPGAGRPLPEEDLSFVPEELRPAFRMLKNAGYLPPEVEARREMASLRALIGKLGETPERSQAMIRLQLLNARLAGAGGRALEPDERYTDAVLSRLSGER